MRSERLITLGSIAMKYISALWGALPLVLLNACGDPMKSEATAAQDTPVSTEPVITKNAASVSVHEIKYATYQNV